MADGIRNAMQVGEQAKASLLLSAAFRCRGLRLLVDQSHQCRNKNDDWEEEGLNGHVFRDRRREVLIFVDQSKDAKDQHDRALQAHEHDDASAEEDKAEHAKANEPAQRAGPGESWFEP